MVMKTLRLQEYFIVVIKPIVKLMRASSCYRFPVDGKQGIGG
jgi:hypothetical protein